MIDSTYLLWHSIDHIDAYGPKSTHARTAHDHSKPVIEKPLENNGSGFTDASVNGGMVAPPDQAHARSEGLRDRNADANAV